MTISICLLNNSLLSVFFDLEVSCNWTKYWFCCFCIAELCTSPCAWVRTAVLDRCTCRLQVRWFSTFFYFSWQIGKRVFNNSLMKGRLIQGESKKKKRKGLYRVEAAIDCTIMRAQGSRRHRSITALSSATMPLLFPLATTAPHHTYNLSHALMPRGQVGPKQGGAQSVTKSNFASSTSFGLSDFNWQSA